MLNKPSWLSVSSHHIVMEGLIMMEHRDKIRYHKPCGSACHNKAHSLFFSIPILQVKLVMVKL